MHATSFERKIERDTTAFTLKGSFGTQDFQRNFKGIEFLCFADVMHPLEWRNQPPDSSGKECFDSQNAGMRTSSRNQWFRWSPRRAIVRVKRTGVRRSKTEQEVEINVTIKLISQIKTFFANINKNGSEKSNLSSQIWIKTQEDQDKFNHSQARTDQIDRFPAGLVRRCWTPLTSDEPPCLPQACHPAIRGCHL
jgi:hypothetical protein